MTLTWVHSPTKAAEAICASLVGLSQRTVRLGLLVGTSGTALSETLRLLSAPPIVASFPSQKRSVPSSSRCPRPRAA